MPAQTGLQSAMVQVMRSGKYSDLKLVCQGREFQIHRNFVCIQSSVFTALCDDGSEFIALGTAKTILITEFDPETVERMVHFLYTGDYDPKGLDGSKTAQDTTLADNNEINKDRSSAMEDDLTGPTSDEDDDTVTAFDQTATNVPVPERFPGDILYATPPVGIDQILLFHIRVNAIGDYYGVPHLKGLANAKISKLLITNMFDKDFAAIIKKVVDSTRDKALRQMLLSAAAVHSDEPIDRSEFPTVEMMSDFAILTFRAIFEKHAAEFEAVKSDLASLISKLKSVTRQLRSAKSKIIYLESLIHNEPNTNEVPKYLPY